MRRLSLRRLLVLILATVVAGLLLLITWGLDRGLDISDESLALLSYLHPDQYPANFSMTYTIVSRVTGWMHPTVIDYRWLTLVLRILTAMAFSFGFSQWLDRFFSNGRGRAVNRTLVSLFVLVGFLSSYGIGHPTLNYNTLNSFFLFSASGLLLYVLSRKPVQGVQPRTVIMALFMVGLFSGLDVLVKFSTAIIMFSGILLVVVLHLRRVGLRAIAVGIGVVILGTMAALAAYFAGVQSIAAWFANYRAELQVVSQVSHNPGSLIRSYLRQGQSLVGVLIRHFSVIFLSSFVIARCYARGWHRKALPNRYMLLAALIPTLLYTGYKVYALDLLDSPYFNGWVTFYSYVLVVCFQVIVLVAAYGTAPLSAPASPLAGRRSEVLLGSFVLLALPFAAAIGTTNRIFLNTLYDVGGWFALILLLGLLIEERTRNNLALSLCVLLPTCSAAIQLIYGMVWKPYLLAATLPEQTIALEQPVSVAGLKVDPATARFVAELRAILDRASFQPNDYILAFYNAPGFVLLMDGVSLGTPQYMQGEDLINCHALQTAKVTKRPVFILTTRSVDLQTVACLQKASVAFPEEFVQVGRIYNPYSATPYGWRAGERWVTVYRQNERR